MEEKINQSAYLNDSSNLVIIHQATTNAQLNVTCFTLLEVVEDLDAKCQRSKADVIGAKKLLVV